MSKPPPFAILGTPRSRTAWFSRFLTYGGTYCFHEPSVSFRDNASLRKFFKPGIGCADSCLTMKWREVRKVARIVLVVRPIDEVLESARRAGLPTIGARMVLPHIAHAIDDIRAEGLAQIVPYDMLSDAVLAKMFQVLLGIECPAWWLAKWQGTRVDGASEVERTAAKARANPKLSLFYKVA